MSDTASFMFNRWVLASNNAGKLKEFERLFAQADLSITVVQQSKLGIDDAIEDGLSFVENSLIKARHASRLSGLPAVADDSGLCVPVLKGRPGIYSARYAGQHGDDAANTNKLLTDLEPYRIDGDSIAAMFVCVITMVQHASDPLPIIAQGIWHGEIATAPQGDFGFGYDPVFWLPEHSKTAAQLDPAHKARISHRGQALMSLLNHLTNRQDVTM